MNVFLTSRRYANRLDLARLLLDIGLRGTGVEVGVWRGDFAAPFLDLWPGTLHLVDPWEKVPGYEDVRAGDDHGANYRFTAERVRRFGERAVLCRHTSFDALSRTPGDLDFVYIDGDHRYSSVRLDLESWWRKLKPGGVLAGHDLFSMTHPGVTSAVVEFCTERYLRAEIVDGDYNPAGVLVNAHSYYIVKP